MTAYTTRIAPSPTGDLHIGTGRTAYFNWLAARASGGKFILRIDDTDKSRSDPTFTQVILECMDWLGLNYDEVVYQSSRFERHRELAMGLVNKGIAEVRDGGAILISASILEGDWMDRCRSTWVDWLGGEMKISKEDKHGLACMVLMKGDGTSSYVVIRGMCQEYYSRVELTRMVRALSCRVDMSEWQAFIEAGWGFELIVIAWGWL